MRDVEVPLANLQRMLCYAWARAPKAPEIDASDGAFDSAEDLFASIVVAETRDLIRRGVGRTYVAEHDELRAPRGRIDLEATMKRQLRIRGRVACSFDELTIDTNANRVVRATIETLGRVARDPKLRDALRRLGHELVGVASVPLTMRLFGEIVRTPGERHYGFLLRVCKLVARRTLAGDANPKSKQRFRDPRKSKSEMGLVFEDFVRAFIARELPDHRVLGERRLDWALVPSTPAAASVVPAMLTDIRVRTPSGDLLIETKYVREALVPRRQGGGRSVRSSHLYQLHAYVSHLVATSAPLRRAILLCGSPGQSFRHSYHLGAIETDVIAVDLAQPWLSVLAAVRNAVVATDQAAPAFLA